MIFASVADAAAAVAAAAADDDGDGWTLLDESAVGRSFGRCIECRSEAYDGWWELPGSDSDATHWSVEHWVCRSH